MHITETNFNKIFYILIPLLLFFGIKLNDKILTTIISIILFYHIYSNYKYSTWPFNSPDNHSISFEKTNPYWTEYVAIIFSMLLIYTSLTKIKKSIFYIVILIFSLIFGISHLRQIFVHDNNYYKWMYN